MDLSGFAGLLDAYGADPARWPADRQAAARRLLASSAEARALQAEAAALDGLLDSVPDPVPSAALVGRVLAAAPAPRPAGRWRRWLAAGEDGWLVPGAGLVAAAVIGVALGATVPLSDSMADGAVTVDEVQFLALGSLLAEASP